MMNPESVIVELEAQDGAAIYLNPVHVVSVSNAPDAATPLALVLVVGGMSWTVRGEALQIAAHIFSFRTAYGTCAVGIARPGHACA